MIAVVIFSLNHGGSKPGDTWGEGSPIEENYFFQGNLDTKPGEYRQTTVSVDSFSPNGYGLYNMHGNVSEWVWDTYGSYGADGETDPTGAESGRYTGAKAGMILLKICVPLTAQHWRRMMPASI